MCGVAEMHIIAAPGSVRFPAAPVIHSTHGEGRESGLSPPDGFWSTSVPPELMNMAGDGIPHGQLDSLCHDLASVSKGGLIHKAGGHALVGGIIPSCLSADDPKVTATSVSGDVPDKLPIPVEINTEVKEQLKMEIRQLGGSK